MEKELKASKPTDFERFQMQAMKFGLLMDDAREYLMSVNHNTPTKEVVEITLEKLGFGRNGLESNFFTD